MLQGGRRSPHGAGRTGAPEEDQSLHDRSLGLGRRPPNTKRGRKSRQPSQVCQHLQRARPLRRQTRLSDASPAAPPRFQQSSPQAALTVTTTARQPRSSPQLNPPGGHQCSSSGNRRLNLPTSAGLRFVRTPQEAFWSTTVNVRPRRTRQVQPPAGGGMTTLCLISYDTGGAISDVKAELVTFERLEASALLSTCGELFPRRHGIGG